MGTLGHFSNVLIKKLKEQATMLCSWYVCQGLIITFNRSLLDTNELSAKAKSMVDSADS